MYFLFSFFFFFSFFSFFLFFLFFFPLEGKKEVDITGSMEVFFYYMINLDYH